MNFYAISSFNSDMWHHFTEDIISLSSTLCLLHSCRRDLINNLKSSVTRVQGIWVKCVSRWLVTSLFNLLSSSHVKHLLRLVNEQINVCAAEDMEKCHQSSTPPTVFSYTFFFPITFILSSAWESWEWGEKSFFFGYFWKSSEQIRQHIGEKDVCDKYSSNKFSCRLSCWSRADFWLRRRERMSE